MSESDEEKMWAPPVEPGAASTSAATPTETGSAHLEQSPYTAPVEQAPLTEQAPQAPSVQAAPVPGYGAPSYPADPTAAPMYGAPQTGYGPPQGFQAPPSGYQAQPAGYQVPPGYQAAPEGYQAPPPGYQAAPPVGYEAPAMGQPLAAPQGYPPNVDPNAGYAPVPPVPGYDPNLAYGAPQAAVQPPKKSRKGLWITLIIIVVLVVGGAAAAVVLLRKSSTDGQAAVKNYLNALAAGDAKKALSDVSTQPPSTTFLTSDILKKQVALAKITNIKVQKPTSNLVHATYTYGTRQVDEEFEVVKSGDSYKLTEGAVKIDVSALTIPSLTLFGKPVSASTGTIYVFPGPLTWGTSNPDFAVSDKDADTWPASPMDASTYDFTLSADLSDTGKQAVMAAVKTYLDACVASKALAPTGCPQQEDDPDGVDGTAAWTLSSDLSSALKYEVDPSTTSSVDVNASTLKFSVSYQSKDDQGNVTQQTDTAEEYLDGTVDLTANPPVFKSN